MVLKLPVDIVSRYDISRLLREIEVLSDHINQQIIKKLPVESDIQVSKQLATLLRDTKISILKQNERDEMTKALQDLKLSAPVVHISFAVEPDAVVTRKIVQWFRKEISGDVLIQIGVQPSIAAGCVVRTTNSYFDFSLRNHLLKNTDKLVAQLKALQ